MKPASPLNSWSCRSTAGLAAQKRRPGGILPTSELGFHLRLNGAVSQGIADAQQGKSIGDLVVVEETLIGLIHTAGQDLAGAGAAGTGAAGIGQIDALFLRGVKDVGVIGAAEAGAVFDRDGVAGHGGLRPIPSHPRGVLPADLYRRSLGHRLLTG